MHLDRTLRFLPLALAASASLATAPVARAQSLSTCSSDYTPGSTANLTGSGWLPGEVVMLEITRADGQPTDGEDHLPFGAVVDASGQFASTWDVCGDCCVGQLLLVTAQGMSSGGGAETFVSDAVAGGTGVVTVAPVGGSCVSGTPPQGNGPYNWEVVEGGSYTMTISGVTECSGSAITVFVQSSSSGNFCFDAVGGNGTYTGSFTMPAEACETFPISYKCGAGAPCNNADTFDAKGPGGANSVHLRASTFDAGCANPQPDHDCGGCVCDGEITFVGCEEELGPDGRGVDLGCNPVLTDIPVCDPNVTAFDNCGPVEVTCAVTEVVQGCRHFRRVDTFAIDCNGNRTKCVKGYTWIEDHAAPSIDDPTDATIACPDQPVFTEPSASDECGSVDVVEVSDETLPGPCPGTYSRTVTWKAVDACGNESAPVSRTVTVVDTTPPEIGEPGPDEIIQCPAVPVFTPPTATDECSAAIVEVVGDDVVTPGPCPDSFSVTRTWRAVDGCGNASGTVDQTITVVDTTPPVIGAPGADQTIECPGVPSFTPPGATDGCGAAVVVEVGDQTNPGACPGSFSRTKTWLAVDGCGNESGTVSQTITVVDATPPEIGQPGADQTISCPDQPSFVPPAATDECGPATVEPFGADAVVPGDCPGSYSITRSWRAVDGCGNASEPVGQTITVVDTTPPVIECPPDLVVSGEGGCTLSVDLGNPVVSDACGPVTVTRTPAASSFPVGESEVVWTVSDPCGNQATCTQRVSVLGRVCVTKFYDANANGIREPGEAPIAGWKFQVVGQGAPPAAFTDAQGRACFDVPAGSYGVLEIGANETNWVATTPTLRPVTIGATQCSVDLEFGNYCFSAPKGGRTIGFWGNPNGKLNLSMHDPAWRHDLNALGLRKANGTAFTVPTTGSFANAYAAFKAWLHDANATNMAYMLSAQLAATTLSVECGWLDDAQSVLVPGGVKSGNGVCLVPLLSTAQPLTCGAPPLLAPTANAGSSSCGCTANDALVSIGDLRARAVCLLGAYGTTTAAGLPRTYEEAVKNLLDMINNNGNNGYACGGISQFPSTGDAACGKTFP